MHKLYFTRHGETVWNVENKICGMTDSPLTERGRAQARALGQKVKAGGYAIDEILYSLASCASFIIFTIFGENIASVVTNASNNVRSISLLINLRLLFFFDNFFFAIIFNPCAYHHL